MTEVQNKATILAVDDSKANRMLMSKIFGEELLQKVVVEDKITISPTPILIWIIPISALINLLIYFLYAKSNNQNQK